MSANGISVFGFSAVLANVGRLLSSGWGLLLPLAFLPLITVIPFSAHQLSIMILLALLATLAMLLSPRLRDYMLLPAGLALVGAYRVIELSFAVI